MKSLSLALSLAAVLLAVPPAAAKAKYTPFKVSRDSIVAAVKTIALSGVRGVPDDHPRRAGIVADFDALLAAELTTAGFEVVPAAVVDSVQHARRDSLGGLFDPATGKPDTTKAHLLRQRTMDALRDEFHADAWLHPTFDVTAAAFDGGTARWMGTSEMVRPKGMLGFLSSNGVSGKVAALTLFVVIEDMTGRDLFADGGGLQVLKKYDARTEFVDVPQDSLWSNPKHNADAVRLALEALTRPPDEKKK